TLKVSACLKRGVKWYVDRLATGSCAAPVGEATDLDASAAPSATPSTSSVPSSSATTKPSPRRH
ncbi:MAG TPA: hypothetical protein VF407_08650, partial [Polyangiaceae bacterium]